MFLYVIFLTTIQFAQPGVTQEEIEEINAAIVASCGSDYGASDIMSVNRSKNTMRQFGFEVVDTYSTLEECFIFLAYTQDQANDFKSTGIVGIYRNHTILWKTNPVIKCFDMRNSVIMGVMDLNLDGNIDIITSWNSGFSGGLSDIWILSWNGTSGWFINDIDEDSSSSVGGFTDDIGVLDRDGDGISELCVSAGCFSWNGSLYGNWDNQPFPEIIPKDALDAEINCKVEKVSGNYKYYYKVKNTISSLQRIILFGIDAQTENISEFNQPLDWHFFFRGDENFIWAFIESPEWNYPEAFIKPGEEKNNYFFTSSGLPKINNIYVQGYNTECDLEIEQVKLNSFVTNTLSPNNPPDSLIQLDFLDTLLNYTQRSFELGWIANQVIADKYDSLFVTTKTLLQGNHIPWVEYTLQSVIDECNQDSSGNITSEAYALLRYNTEYLLEHLPEAIPPVLTSITPQMILRYVSGGNPPTGLTVTATGENFSDSSIAYFNGSAKTTTVISDTVLTFPITGSEMSTLGSHQIWISTYGINSDISGINVVDNLNILLGLLVPTLQCVRNNGGGSYTAYFGYVNDNGVSIYIPIGSKNKFVSLQIDKGQPKLFLPGTHTNVFSVNFNGKNLTWTLDQASVTANKNSTPCP
ncbi:MAG: hypothetical protein D8M26_03630 [Ignavibacteriae bacterium]|nr:MAG: hypothetical protein EDM72_09290 [Chlorobiota bacterium]MBL1121959.1 hypothetical protein [Ignavibacteriota bacterium]MCE7857798.1 hypothetical protein [Ignavibacteria bacterium CHB3]